MATGQPIEEDVIVVVDLWHIESSLLKLAETMSLMQNGNILTDPSETEEPEEDCLPRGSAVGSASGDAEEREVSQAPDVVPVSESAAEEAENPTRRFPSVLPPLK